MTGRPGGIPAWAALTAVGVAFAGGLAATPSPTGSTPFKDGPPARLSGGFGEETCWACHFDAEENDPAGSLTLSGVPDRFVPGESYRLTLTLTRPKMRVGGFQLTARFAEDGVQAGTLAPLPEEVDRIGVLVEREVQYAHHLLPGVELAAPDTARWTLLWRAPEAEAAHSGPTVLFHAAGVAGDGDDSQIGDFVYSTSAESPAATP